MFRILLELSPSEEPLWAYFDAQHVLIMDNMRDTFATAVSAIKGAWWWRPVRPVPDTGSFQLNMRSLQRRIQLRNL